MMNRTLEAELEAFLDLRIRPELACHGGDLHVLDLEDGVLSVKLTGQCSGCPSAEITMKAVVEDELIRAFPVIHQVIAVNGVSDDLLNQARELLNSRFGRLSDRKG